MSQLAVPCSGIGPIAMSHPRSTCVPTYSGLVNDSIEDFLWEYKEFTDSYGLMNHQKVETIMHYMISDL
jgi:hypothetical protein